MYGKRSGSMRLVLGVFGMKIWRCWVSYAFQTPRMDLEHDECCPKSMWTACRKSSVHSRSIRHVRKAFGKHTESIRKGNLSKSTCGKYSVYSESIRKPYCKHLETKREAFGDTLGKTHSEGHSTSLKHVRREICQKSYCCCLMSAVCCVDRPWCRSTAGARST